MTVSTISRLAFSSGSPQAGQPFVLEIEFSISAMILFEVDLAIEGYAADGTRRVLKHAHEDGASAVWLPRGKFRWRMTGPDGDLALAGGQIVATLLYRDGPNIGRSENVRLPLGPQENGGHSEDLAMRQQRAIASARFTLDGDPDPAKLSWRRGHEDWFFRHFDHAGPTIGSYFFKDSELLRGRVLDMGCGDGITDLSLYLRYQPERFVGVDPYRGYERLPQILAEQGLSMDPWPANLEFMPADGNHLPFADDSFDAVVSWGSVEHIKGGYKQALREIKRVLRPDGLLFIHPGLYYSNLGHHLGEFSDEPFFHLKRRPDELREFVLSTPPRYMDRSGEFATNEQYWQWYTELNPITVAGFEQELRALDFEPWRVALRTEPIIEYTPEILNYPIQDLSTAELYMSCWNRKIPRPAGI